MFVFVFIDIIAVVQRVGEYSRAYTKKRGKFDTVEATIIDGTGYEVRIDVFFQNYLK